MSHAPAARETQAGQTLLVFALTAGLLMVALLALVGDNAVLQVHFNRVDEAAVLAVQAASADVDVPAFVKTHRVRLAEDAEQVCRDVARANEPAAAIVTCYLPPDRSYIRADISEQGGYAVQFFGPAFAVRASHVGRPAYGVTQPCTDPTNPATCQ